MSEDQESGGVIMNSVALIYTIIEFGQAASGGRCRLPKDTSNYYPSKQPL